MPSGSESSSSEECEILGTPKIPGLGGAPAFGGWVHAAGAGALDSNETWMGEGLLWLFPWEIDFRSLTLSAWFICTLTVLLSAGLVFANNEGGPLAGSGRTVVRYFSSKDLKRPTVTGAEGSVSSVAPVSSRAFLLG